MSSNIFQATDRAVFHTFSKLEDSQILLKIAEKKLCFWFVTFAFDEKWLMKVNFAWTFENRLNDKQQKRSDTIFPPKRASQASCKNVCKEFEIDEKHVRILAEYCHEK